MSTTRLRTKGELLSKQCVVEQAESKIFYDLPTDDRQEVVVSQCPTLHKDYLLC